MSETEHLRAPRLWTKAGFGDDRWVRADLPEPDKATILPLAAYLELEEPARDNAAAPVAVELQPADAIDAIVPHLKQLPLIVLVFPAFSDGRSYSKAELLRSRHGYKGSIRASGEVLIDQIPHMVRTGIDEFEIANETALARLSDGRLGGLPLHYQPAAKASQKAGSYSWRRQPA